MLKTIDSINSGYNSLTWAIMYVIDNYICFG